MEKVEYQNNIIFITGSSSGIGEATAYQFAKNKNTVIVTYHTDEKKGQKVVEKCEQLGAKDVYLVRLELLNDDSINLAIDEIINKYGKIDILINNAGVLKYSPLVEIQVKDIEEEIKVNLESPIKITKKCLPYLKKSIIYIGSNIIFHPKKNLTVYSATKAGLNMFSQCMAREYPNLKIYTVNPTLTNTKMGKPEGMNPDNVANIIYQVATGQLRKQSGDSINMVDYLYDQWWKRIAVKIKHFIFTKRVS